MQNRKMDGDGELDRIQTVGRAQSVAACMHAAASHRLKPSLITSCCEFFIDVVGSSSGHSDYGPPIDTTDQSHNLGIYRTAPWQGTAGHAELLLLFQKKSCS